MFFLNPFKKHDVSEFPDTHIDLEKATHRNSIVSAHHSVGQTPDAEKDGKSSGKDSDARSGSASIHAGTTRGLTIAELREEIDSDVAANDSQSVYDSKYNLATLSHRSMMSPAVNVPWNDCCIGKSKIINRAIADMGMGRYQWQLFALCGFGWLADK